MKNKISEVASVVLLFFTTGVSFGSDCVWTGEAGDGKWSTSANWQNQAKPSAGDTVTVSGVGAVDGEIINDIGELQLAKITFAGSVPFRLVGSAVSPVAAGSEFMRKSAEVAVTNSLAIALPAGDTIIVNGKVNDFVLEGDISGEGARLLAKGEHDRKLVFAGENTQTGGIRDGASNSIAFANALAAGPAGTLVDANRYVFFLSAGEYLCDITNRYDHPEGDVYYYFLDDGMYDFKGEISGSCTKRILLMSYRGDNKSTSGKIIFRKGFRFPYARCYPVLAKNYATEFHGPVVLPGFAGGDYASESNAAYEFLSPDNDLEYLTPSYTGRIFVKNENAFSEKTVLLFDQHIGNRNLGVIDLCGFDQTFNRISNGGLSKDKYGEIRSTGGSATLTLKGTESAVTQVALGDDISIVWAPADKSFEQVFSNKVHTTTGDITVTNGIFCVERDASFANVENIKIEKDGVFRLKTTVNSALGGVKRISVASGGAFEVVSGATPFGAGTCTLEMESGARFTLPQGISCNFARLLIDGAPVAEGTYCGDPASDKYLEQLSGAGSVTVLSRSKTCIWTGSAGDGKWSTSGNWQDGEKPGTGDEVTVSGDGAVNGEVTNDIGELRLTKILLSGNAPFRLAGCAVSSYVQDATFLEKTADVAVTNALALKLLSGDTVVVNGGSGDFVLAGDISGEDARVVAKGGSSNRIVFAGENTNSGGIRDGASNSLVFDSPASAGPAGSIVDANGYIWFNAAGEYLCSVTNRASDDYYYYFLKNGTYDFRGDFSGSSMTTVRFFSKYSNIMATSATMEFHGAFNFPEADFYPVLDNGFTTRFRKPVTVDVFYGNNWDSNIASIFEFYDTNTVDFITPSCSCRLFMKKADAFGGNTAIRYDKTMHETGIAAGILDLCGFDQTFNRVFHSGASAESNRGAIRSTGAPATLTLKGSESAMTRAVVEDVVSVVWAPSEKSLVQTFSDRVHTTSGDITVTNGIFSVEGAASFAKVGSITVEKDGVFRLDTTLSGALAGLKSLNVAEGGVFEILSGESPFAPGEVVVNVASGGVLRIPEGLSCDLRGVRLDGEPVAGGVYSAEDVSWIEGGSFIVRELPVERVDASWTGDGASASVANAENWSWTGSALPPLVGGALVAAFAQGGALAEIDLDVDLKGVLFSGASKEFELAGEGTLALRGEGIAVGGDCTNALVSAPVALLENQTWNVAAGAALRLDAGVAGRYGTESVHKTGAGALYLNSPARSMGNFTLGSRTEDGGIVYVNTATNAFGPASDDFEVRICGITESRSSQGAIEFKTSSVVERPFVLDSQNTYYVFTLGSDATVRFTKNVKTTAATRLLFRAGAHAICEGGATLKSWTCFSGATSAKWTFRGETPIVADYLYMPTGPSVSLETAGNTVGGIDIQGSSTLYVTRPYGLNTKEMNVLLSSPNAVISVSGDQMIGGFRKMTGGKIVSAEPSTVTFNQYHWSEAKDGPVTNLAVNIAGAVTLLKKGSSLYVQDCASDTTGGIGVEEGVLRMTEKARFRNATKFLVKGQGRAELEGRRLLGRRVCVDMDSTAKLKLDGGQHVESFRLDGVEMLSGTYGARRSGAKVELDCFEGTGVLTVGNAGTFLVVR